MAVMAYTILVADDEPAIRTMLEVILSADGHEIVAVPDGRAALAYLQSHTPDALLLDVKMPYMDGFEICSRVKRIKRLRGCAVLLLSTVDDDQTRDQAKLVGADDIVVKPVSGKLLRGRVNQLIEARRGGSLYPL
ncbi:response regulator [Deinococcus radiodurans]|jgi:Response regulator containing a CheY-like receiver domain and an HD-GYP domain|uniref:Response regulator n=1 Tax=Deinococcus radiodurans (strain ATCC 13939 / DSM 20539 / JCM 16871 / CCUG 27074 / LMG 4051 / NBRC 15346 / NCIMB 9279 / VKM B-1422 / R1) TaxID=243230 RepID=Q9RUG8_DEIRA|nr:response regulator [Deinococcus radiodurans]AAF10982.1 response regulator [Deinococcus radiodurans R1 = ATCC 13939 = DSM 20539]ANC71439.1 response regulator [Deinococcus radiodurans R1 = ATCC 13939 = DSM 20539]QEM70872.1 response regulator [Deinococcus radiodurans]QIP29439.1 response regulator [Deinococcus radiodurans]QIP31870.1 response regulator [Deinococcus radiodurans]